MFRSLILAAVLLAFTPLAANAGEITLLPSIKLQTMSGEKIAGGVMTTATIVAGTNAKLMSAVIVKAGTIVTTIAVAGVATNIIINVTKGPTGPFVFTNRVRFLPTARY